LATAISLASPTLAFSEADVTLAVRLASVQTLSHVKPTAIKVLKYRLPINDGDLGYACGAIELTGFNDFKSFATGLRLEGGQLVAQMPAAFFMSPDEALELATCNR